WLKSRIQQPTKFEYANDERLGKLLYLDDNAPCTPSHLPNKRHKAQHLQQSRDKSVWPFLHLIKYAKTHHELAGLRLLSKRLFPELPFQINQNPLSPEQLLGSLTLSEYLLPNEGKYCEDTE